MRGPRIRAVLETSFWVAAYRAEVAANCLDLFEIIVPRAVEAELLGVQASAPSREYPYATLFRHLRSQMSGPPVPTPPSLRLFGAGEAEAIPLALALNARLLINERRAAQYATSLGIEVRTVPGVIVALSAQGVISLRAARTKLRLIESITAREIMGGALRALEAL
jgi:predicted nucleic acid-binding protein